MNQLDTDRRSGASTAKALAHAVGVSQPDICDLRYNRRKPSDDVAQRIEAATGGQVGRLSWSATAQFGAA